MLSSKYSIRSRPANSRDKTVSGSNVIKPAIAIKKPIQSGDRGLKQKLTHRPLSKESTTLPCVMTEMCKVLTQGLSFAVRITRETMTGLIVTPNKPISPPTLERLSVYCLRTRQITPGFEQVVWEVTEPETLLIANSNN
jgi:hypothetical protein